MPDQCARQHVVLRPLRFRFSPLTFRGFPLRGRTDGAIQRGALRRPFVRLPGSSMHLQTIVAITDFSAAAEQALDRAAMVAADHHARLRIHYGTDTPDPKFADPHARLEQRARQLARRHDVAVVAARQGTGDVVADALAATAGADLLGPPAAGFAMGASLARQSLSCADRAERTQKCLSSCTGCGGFFRDRRGVGAVCRGAARGGATGALSRD